MHLYSAHFILKSLNKISCLQSKIRQTCRISAVLTLRINTAHHPGHAGPTDHAVGYFSLAGKTWVNARMDGSKYRAILEANRLENDETAGGSLDDSVLMCRNGLAKVQT